MTYGKIILPRTCRIKTDFISSFFMGKYFPNESKSGLVDVSVQIPQYSITPIKQVNSRRIHGIYAYQQRPVSVSFKWLCDRDEAHLKFLAAIEYFQSKTNGLYNFTTNLINQCIYISSAEISISELNPANYTLNVEFLNINDITDTNCDPLEFIGIQFDENEKELSYKEENNDIPVISCSYSVFMRSDLLDSINGYRSVKFGEAVMSQSEVTIKSEYTPSFMYNEYIYENTGSIQLTKSMSENSPRTYSFSRQCILIPIGENIVGLDH